MTSQSSVGQGPEPWPVAPMPLSEVLSAGRAAGISTTEVRGDCSGIDVALVSLDHRGVLPGALHCCLTGASHDGHDFAGEAIERGAVALVVEHPVAGIASMVPQIVLGPGRVRPAMAHFASAVARFPARRLTMVGVTGTNGKTTTVELLGGILTDAGHPTLVLGTLHGERTTPEAPELQRRLAEWVERHGSHVVMEVASHGLAEHRVDGVRFGCAVFTNLTQDHLDYHGTMERYFEVKASLFTPEHAQRAVVCRDDPYGLRLIDRAAIPTDTYGISDAEELEVDLFGARFSWRGGMVDSPLGGRFAVQNALAAAAAAAALGCSVAQIVASLSAPRSIPGRCEVVPAPVVCEEALPTVVVDYAHTPDALRAILSVAAQQVRGSAEPAELDRPAELGTPIFEGGGAPRVIAVVGCGGDRDRAKRPMMGSVATRIADLTVLTSDNPRSEDPIRIIEEIAAGCDGPGSVQIEPDRHRAIVRALELAGRGDVVIVAGRGHEATQEVAGQRLAFDDRAVVRDALASLAAARSVEREAGHG